MDTNKQYTYDELPSSLDASFADERVSVAQLRRLVHLLDESDVSEIEVNRHAAGMHLVLRKARAGEATVLSTDLAAVPVKEQPPVAVETAHPVPAPLVGIFHDWTKPGGKKLVAVGDHVKVGQLVGSIQSLNVLIEVESPRAGTVVELLIHDGEAVEYGQPLMLIESAEEA